MLSFVTRSDLEAAEKQADVSMETRNHFLNKLLHEHGQTGIRKQLQTLWTERVEKNYGDKQQTMAARLRALPTRGFEHNSGQGKRDANIYGALGVGWRGRRVGCTIHIAYHTCITSYLCWK
jgi:hypothetical protein